MMRTTNPSLNANVFLQERSFGFGNAMTLQGTVNKTFALLFVLLLSASWVWGKIMQPTPMFGLGETRPVVDVGGYIMGGAIAGFIVALITIFKKQWAKITAPIYALCQGLFLGGISAMMELRYPGIVIQAVALTFGTLFCLLLAYKLGLIKASENFKLGVFAATGSIALVYFLSFILGFFGIHFPFIHGSGIMGIGFSLFVVGIAALNLVLDFDFIEQGVQMGVPKYMEWYGAFGLMVTLIWLYVEILRLLAKLRERR